MNEPGDFERELERGLHRILDPIAAAPIPPRRASASGGFAKRLFGAAGAAVGLKVLTGFAVAAFAAAAAGAVTEVAITRSLNPADWEQQLTKHPQGTDRSKSTQTAGPDDAKGNAGSTGTGTGASGSKRIDAATGGSTGPGNASGGSGTGSGTSAPGGSKGIKHPGPTPVPIGAPLPPP